MERNDIKIDVAKILKDKPKGIKLYSPIFGKIRYDELIYDLGKYVIVVSDKAYTHHSFLQDCKFCRFGEPLLTPSKEMQDWSKFAWEKGDILIGKNGCHVVFEEFYDDEYTMFSCKHFLCKTSQDCMYISSPREFKTSDFEKDTDLNRIEKYISEIKERYKHKIKMNIVGSNEIAQLKEIATKYGGENTVNSIIQQLEETKEKPME